MIRKFALKRLTASDLTFFVWHFKNHNAGNQKAINLNADVFVGRLFPSLPGAAISMNGRIPIDLYIYGPGLQPELNLQRKIIKIGSYKNWRLDGEFIYDPETNPDRFHSLQPDDLVLFEFLGEIVPNVMKTFFIAQSVEADHQLYEAFRDYISDRSMVETSYPEIEELIAKAAPPEEHPIYELLLEADLEDAAEGGAEGLKRVYSRPAGRRLSKIELANAVRRVEEIGQIGEEFVNAYLERLKSSGQISEFQWVSTENAVAPFDFWYEESGNRILLDVKATTGDFERNLHVSLPELQIMQDTTNRYLIFRVYSIVGNTAKLRISGELSKLSTAILAILAGLPKGINADGVSLAPNLLDFGAEIDLTLSLPAADIH